ncbi:MAG: hypothetical protein IH983_08345 [Planctomycetes bacterium]|nr:hypothetical protein [Planctomycetota bacterium]
MTNTVEGQVLNKLLEKLQEIRDAVWVQYSAQLQIALCQELGYAGEGSFVARIWHACDGLRR